MDHQDGRSLFWGGRLGNLYESFIQLVSETGRKNTSKWSISSISLLGWMIEKTEAEATCSKIPTASMAVALLTKSVALSLTVEGSSFWVSKEMMTNISKVPSYLFNDEMKSLIFGMGLNLPIPTSQEMHQQKISQDSLYKPSILRGSQPFVVRARKRMLWVDMWRGDPTLQTIHPLKKFLSNVRKGNNPTRWAPTSFKWGYNSYE